MRVDGERTHRVDGDAAEERHVELLGQRLAAADGEDGLDVAAARADEAAHVLHDAENRHVHLLAERQLRGRQ